MSQEQKNGPNSWDHAAAMARTSQNQSPTYTADTTLWSHAARQAYYANGGK